MGWLRIPKKSWRLIGAFIALFGASILLTQPFTSTIKISPPSGEVGFLLFLSGIVIAISNG